MHNKAVFALAGVFLLVALVVPPVMLIMQAQNELERLIIIQNDPGHFTSGNTTYVDEITQSRPTAYLLIGLIEAVFVALFIVTVYYGIKHIHPIH